MTIVLPQCEGESALMIKFPLTYHTVADAATQSDKQLLVKVQHHKKAALETLYARYSADGENLAFYILRDRVMAQEVTLEAFCQVWRLAFQFCTAQGTFSDWLYGIVHQLSIEALTLRKTAPFPRAVSPTEAHLTYAGETYSDSSRWLPMTLAPISSAQRSKLYLRNKSRAANSPLFIPRHRRAD
jgi:DNA-directed RNA polymerase specialized sigma24 family protein